MATYKLFEIRSNLNLLSSDQLSDFTITCGGYRFSVHRSVLFLFSEYFKKLVAGSFEESQSRVVDFPEEEPSLLVRGLLYIYAGYYDPVPISRSCSSIPQFSCVTDLYSTDQDCSWQRLHANMFALGTRWCSESMKHSAARNFANAFLNWRNMEPKYDRGAHNIPCCQVKGCEDENYTYGVCQLVYESTPSEERTLRDIVVSAVHDSIALDGGMCLEEFREMLGAIPDLAVDLITYPRIDKNLVCKECKASRMATSRMCECENWAHDCDSYGCKMLICKRPCWKCWSEDSLRLMKVMKVKRREY